MSFLIDGNALTAAISTVVKVIGKQPDSLVLSNSKKPNALMLKGFGDGRYITHEFPASSVKNKFKIGVPVDRLTFIAQKRTALQFNPSTNGGSLSYNALSGNYKGHIETIETSPIEFPEIDTKASKSMTAHLKTALFDLFPLVSLSPMFVSLEMMLFIDIDDSSIKVAAADNFHAALASMPISSKENKTRASSHTFPFKYVAMIAGTFSKGAKIEMLLDDAHLHLYNDSTSISLPLVDTATESISMDAIRKYFAKLTKAEATASFDVNIDDVKLCLNNMNGIKDVEKNSELYVAVTNEKLRLQMDSKHGSITDAIDIINRGDSKAKIKLEPNTMQDIFDKIEGSCSVKFYGQQHILIDSKNKEISSKYIAVAIQSTPDSKKTKE